MRCLVAHSPNPQLCAMQGGAGDEEEQGSHDAAGVWDDSSKNGQGPT